MKVLDVGSGPGTYVDAMRAVGIKAMGVDPFGPLDPTRELYRLNVLVPGDRAAVQLVGPFDVVLCLEVAEHLRPEDGPLFIEVLSNLAPVVIFSAAVPGQGGEGHIHLVPVEYWIEQFAVNGMAEDEALTASLVTHITTTCPFFMRWLPQNVRVYRRFDQLYYARIEAEEATQAQWIAEWLVKQSFLAPPTGSPSTL